MTGAAEVLALARAKGLRIATAESCTGGLISGALTEVAGSSDVFDRGFVTYSNAAKVEMLGIRPETLAAHGAVSEEIAAEMARGAGGVCDRYRRAGRVRVQARGAGLFRPCQCAGLADRNCRVRRPWP